MHDKDRGEVNPFHTYPWDYVVRPGNGQPMIASAEMAIGYRFHELIINEMPIIVCVILYFSGVFNNTLDRRTKMAMSSK